jgi:hypothetical protein
VIYSRTTPSIPESSRFTVGQPAALDTVRCTTGQSGVPGRAGVWLHTAKSFPLHFFFSWPCFYHLDNYISVQNNILNLETYFGLHFSHIQHIRTQLICDGNLITKILIEIAQGHISLSISPFLVIYANTSKRNKISVTSMQLKTKLFLLMI